MPRERLFRVTRYRLEPIVVNIKDEREFGDEKIGERDIERIENELLRFLDQNHKMPPGNIAIEGGSHRHFTVQFQFVDNKPLPQVTLQPGELGENRRISRRIRFR